MSRKQQKQPRHGSAVRETAKHLFPEFRRYGRPVDERRIDDPNEPSLILIEDVQFIEGKMEYRSYPIDETKLPAGFLEEEAAKPAAKRQLAYSDKHELEDGQEYTGYMASFGYREILAELDDEFGTRLRPATDLNFRPSLERVYPLLAANVSYSVTRGRNRRTVANGSVLPVNPVEDGLSKAEYQPPRRPNDPVVKNVAFMPSRSGDGVMPIACDSRGKPIEWDGRYEFPESKYGTSIPVALREERRRIVARPYVKLETEKPGVTMTPRLVTEVELTEDQYEWNGEAHELWPDIQEYKVTKLIVLSPGGPDAVRKAGKKMERDFHPDSDPVLCGYKESGLAPPKSLVSARALKQLKLRAAFDRALTLATDAAGDREEQQKADRLADEKASQDAEVDAKLAEADKKTGTDKE